MDSLIREEDYITAYDILSPLLEILKERVTYIITSSECPADLRAQLDSVIYASTRLEFEELFRLRDLIMRKYGTAYIQKAESNVDKLVNINLVEKLKIKPASDAFLTIRLKQLCKEKKIPFEFPSEISSDIAVDIGNPFNGPGGDFNPYASTQGNNPFGPGEITDHKETIIPTILQVEIPMVLPKGHPLVIHMVVIHLNLKVHLKDHHKVVTNLVLLKEVILINQCKDQLQEVILMVLLQMIIVILLIKAKQEIISVKIIIIIQIHFLR